MIGAAEEYGRLEDLPAACAPLFAAAGETSFFLGRIWWESVLEAGMENEAAAVFLLFRCRQRPVALLVLQTRNRGRKAEGLTNPYTCLYAPLLAAELNAAALHRVGERLAEACRRWPVVRLDACEPGSPAFSLVLAGMEASGRVVRQFDQFGNWHEPVAGMTWAEYLQRRPGALRETLRRRTRALARDGLSFELLAAPAEVEAGITAYECVYAKSWKVPEPMPAFNPALMRRAAESGLLRLGVLRAADGCAVAAQLWVVAAGQACLLKLAHDQAFKTYSPGTVLTGLMIERLLDGGRLFELDFGRGDDGYKRLWAGSRRRRVGLLLIDPRRPAGLAALARQLLGGLRRWGHAAKVVAWVRRSGI